MTTWGFLCVDVLGMIAEGATWTSKKSSMLLYFIKQWSKKFPVVFCGRVFTSGVASGVFRGPCALVPYLKSSENY